MEEKLFNNGKCLLIRTEAGSDSAECAVCGKKAESIFVTAPICDKQIPECDLEHALKSRLPSIVKLAIGYSRWYVTQVLTGKATSASQDLIDARLDVCETNECGLYKPGRCFDCGCFINRLRSHEAANKASWLEKDCERGFWKNLKK